MSAFLQPARLSLAVAAALAAFSNTACAVDTLEEVVVTATRSPQALTKALSDVSVIRTDTLAASGQASLADLLQGEHGIEMSRAGGPQSATSLFLRGANGAQTLVLIDGQRIGSATLGGASLQAIPLAQIEKVEVLRGPASALYGADAIGGVLNIITKKPKEGLAINGSVGAGSYGGSKANAGLSGQVDNVSFALNVGHERSDGFSAIAKADPFGQFNPDADGYELNSASGQLGLNWAQGHKLNAQFMVSRLQAQFDGGPALDDRQKDKNYVMALSSEDQLSSQWLSRVRLGESVDESDVFSVYPGRFKTRQQQIGWQNELALNEAVTATLGLERLEEKVESTDFSNMKTRATNSASVLLQYSDAAHGAQMSARRDDSNQYGENTTGALQYGYAVSPALRVSASVGSGFRAPTFNDLYYPGYGQTSIQPERSLNKEVAVRWQEGGGRASLVVYHNRVRDLIEFQSPCSNPAPEYAYGCASNVSEALLRGISLGWQLRREKSQLNVQADLQDPRNESTGKQLARRAKRQLKLGLERNLGVVQLGAEVRASGRRFDDGGNTVELPGYALLGLQVSYAFNRQLKLNARLDNVSDVQYELAKGYNTAGRSVFVSLNFSN